MGDLRGVERGLVRWIAGGYQVHGESALVLRILSLALPPERRCDQKRERETPDGKCDQVNLPGKWRGRDNLVRIEFPEGPPQRRHARLRDKIERRRDRLAGQIPGP